MKNILFSLFWVALSHIALAQESPKVCAEKNFAAGDYKKALPCLLEYQKLKPNDNDLKLKIGVAYLYTNQPVAAQPFLEYVVQNNKKAGDANWYLARVYHLQNKYAEAIALYKAALVEMGANDPRRYWLKDDIRRCAKGMAMEYAEQISFIDALPEGINSNDEEYAPVFDRVEPTLVFLTATSQKGNNIGGERADIFATTFSQSDWSAAISLGEGYNTAQNDQLLDVSQDGVFVYFAKEDEQGNSDIYYAPYQPEDSTIANKIQKMPSPINTEAWDGDAYFFRDSIVIFASDRTNGVGGKDLYVSSINENGEWRAPINLGTTINSPYDEVAPFLAKDGRTLYFSANNLNSIGGFDVFRSYFNDTTKTWSKPVNLGMPINSTSDDSYMRITSDGQRALMASNRIGGRGGYDLYNIYFRKPAAGSQKARRPASFVEIIAPNKGTSSSTSFPGYSGNITTTNPPPTDNNTPTPPPEEEVKQRVNLRIAPIFYGDANMLALPGTTTQLTTLANTVAPYQETLIELTAHTDDDSKPNLNLYFALKRLDELSNFLIKKGIPANRILLKSCGRNYPIAQNRDENDIPNSVGQGLNRRIEIRVLNTDNTPLDIQYTRPVIAPEIESPKGNDYATMIKGLTYKVQIKAMKQIFDDPSLSQYKDAMIETSPGTGILRYTVGLTSFYSTAEGLLKQVTASTFKDAFIVPYLNGRRIPKDELPNYIGRYPELAKLLK